MVKERIYWYRKILTMVTVMLTMVLLYMAVGINGRSMSVAQSSKKVVPCGFPVGLYLETEGVLVVGTGTVCDESGVNYEPSYGVVKKGDYIVSINSINISNKAQLRFLINKYGKEDVVLGLKRKDQIIQVKITPVCGEDNEYRLGIWVRDDTQGIGTMTYITFEGKFGALGHGIADIDTKNLLDTDKGILYYAKIWGINKSYRENTGSLCGIIEYTDNNKIGKITGNTDNGIYGIIEDREKIGELMDKYSLKPMETAEKNQVDTGKAYIRSMVSGKIEDYEIEIVEFDQNAKDNKGLVIKIKDRNLIEMTGGIVQGMSGSPIIQNGRIVGAVTHVLVNDPTKGYGIFIGNMLANN